MSKNGMRPVHPGEILREEYLAPLGMSANALANALSIPAPRINDIVLERRGVSADTAIRLARYFGGDAGSWLHLQSAYDLRVAEISSAKRIMREVKPVTATQRGTAPGVAPVRKPPRRGAAAVRPATRKLAAG